MLIVNSVRHERTRGKQCTVVLSSIYLRALYELFTELATSRSGRWTDGRAEGIDTSPDPSSDQGTAHWHGGGSRGERGWPGCHWPTIRWRRTSGMLGKVSTGHLWLRVALSSHGPQRKRASDAFPALVSSVGHHIARGCSTSVLLRVICHKALRHGHGSSLHGEEGKALRKKQRYLLDIFAEPYDTWEQFKLWPNLPPPI